MMSDSLSEFALLFLECAIHSIIYTRKIYPDVLFEQRKYLGVTIWQCRHPDVNSYIRRVLNNCKELIIKGLVERLIVQTSDPLSGKTLDQISIKCLLLDPSLKLDAGSDSVNRDDVFTIEEEFRSTILRLSLLDSQLQKPPNDAGWSIIVVTRSDIDDSSEEILQTALCSGEWIVDNNQLSDQQALAARATGNHSVGSSSIAPPQLIPIKSFRNIMINMSYSMTGVESVEVTAEDMEVYRMKRSKANDPMAALLDSEEVLEYK